MNRSRAAHRASSSAAADGRLAHGWSVDEAADLFYTVTMQGPWRELTRELGWSPEQYANRVARLLLDTLVKDGRGESSAPSTDGPKDARPDKSFESAPGR